MKLKKLTIQYVKDKNLPLLDLTDEDIRTNYISYLNKNNVPLIDQISLLMGNFKELN